MERMQQLHQSKAKSAGDISKTNSHFEMNNISRLS
jgi:hypothetical protein